jgi:CheY-like chemotaxis protein
VSGDVFFGHRIGSQLGRQPNEKSGRSFLCRKPDGGDPYSPKNFLGSEAEDGPSGLRIVQAGSRIDFLITDVSLPNGLNGRQVADAARSKTHNRRSRSPPGSWKTRPSNGHLDPGMSIITKPFVNSAFANKVRQLIDD